MRFSSWCPCGQWSLSNKRSRVEIQYRGLADNYGPNYDLTPGGPNAAMEATVYAKARALARVDTTLKRAGNQRKPALAVELLSNLESDYEITPSPLDTIATRQARLVAMAKASQGATIGTILSGLRAILGSTLTAVRFLATSEATAYPTWPSAAATQKAKPTLPTKLPKDVVLGDVVAITGSAVTVAYSNLVTGAAEQDLAVGDKVVVDPGSSWLSEVVTVTAVSGTGVGRTFTATYAYPHAAGTIATTRDWPYEWSTQAYVLVVVGTVPVPTPAVTADTRRKINDYMARVGRGVWQWAIVSPQSTLRVGPFTLDYSPLGATTVGAFNYQPAP